MEIEEVMLVDHYGPGFSSSPFDVHTNTIEGFWQHFRREQEEHKQTQCICIWQKLCTDVLLIQSYKL